MKSNSMNNVSPPSNLKFDTIIRIAIFFPHPISITAIALFRAFSCQLNPCVVAGSGKFIVPVLIKSKTISANEQSLKFFR